MDITIGQLLTDYWQILAAIGSVFFALLAFALLVVKWVSRTNTRMDGFDTEFKKINELLNTILLRLTKPIAQTESPVQLNDYGNTISEQVEAKSIIDKVLSDVPVKSDMNEYQIQQTCFEYANRDLLKSVSAEEKNRVEKLAYDEGIELESVLRVLGIELRDAVLKKFGKNPSQIDQHDPDRTASNRG